MGRPASHEKRIEWTTRIAAWRASGLSGRVFAEREGVSRASLYMWARRLDAKSTPRFARVVPATPWREHATVASPLHVVVGSVTIRVEPGFDEAHLSAVVRALGGMSR